MITVYIIHFCFVGSDNDQANLIESLIKRGIRMLSFEEKRSSFEEMLVEVAEASCQL